MIKSLLSNSSAVLRLLALLCALGLVSCQQSATQFSNGNNGRLAEDAANQQPARPLTPNVKGEKIGAGPIRVAMLLPLSASGAAGAAGNELANAAKMAMQDFAGNNFELVIKDTMGLSAEASILAGQARDEGASLVLGPLFSANVSAASGVTEPARIPMIAFSSDILRARAGVYLLSFAPDADIQRTLTYGLQGGANRVVALFPESSYGRLAEQELRRIYDQYGGEILTTVRYQRDTNAIVTAARSVAQQAQEANAIYIPEGGKVPALILNSLKQAGVRLSNKQIMGSGQWTGTNKRDSVINGAIFAGADRTGFDGFANRYNEKYGNLPTVTAALGYDAISLVAELIRRDRTQPFATKQIESRSGFRGATGIFRFESNGRLQRALVVNKIVAGKPQIISPAPTGFSNSSFGPGRYSQIRRTRLPDLQ